MITELNALDKKITDWKNEPTLIDLKQNITDAQSEYDKHISKINSWVASMNVREVSTGDSTRSKVAPKLIRKQAEWRYSSLAEPFLSTPDLFNINPVTAGDKKRAEQNELVLNNQFNTKLNKTHFIDSYIRDAVDLGTVIVKVGWDTEEEVVKRIVPTYAYQPNQIPAQIQEYTQLLQMRTNDPEQYADYSTPGLDEVLDIFAETGEAYLPIETGSEEIEEVVETKNQPTVEICNHNNIIIDPSCNGNISKASFWGERFKTSLSELKKDGKYINLDLVDMNTESPLANPDFEEGKDNDAFNFTDKARKQCIVNTYWGNWDINDTGVTVPIVASWIGDVIIRLEENPYPDKKPPFILVPYMPVRDSVFGEPDGALLESNQKIIGAVTRGVIDLLGKSANGQQGIRKDMLDMTNKRKFKRGDDYEFNATVDPRQGFYTHVYPEIPQSAYNMLNLQNAEAESLTGVKAFHSGISGQALGNTATGIRSALDASSKRELNILRRLATGITDIGRKIISMNAVFLSEEEVVRVTAENFVHIRRDDLAGNFDLSLSISTAEEDNKKAEELAFMLQTTGNNMDAGLHNMILSEIANLRKMPALAKRIETFKPEPDPMAQKEAELQLALLEAQVHKEQSIAQKNEAAAALDMARISKEEAQAELNLSKSDSESSKSRHLTSKADKEDLDYIEQESGVNQERALEQLHVKHGHNLEQQQHKANTDLVNQVAMQTPEA